jgi:hypothetical protein
MKWWIITGLALLVAMVALFLTGFWSVSLLVSLFTAFLGALLLFIVQVWCRRSAWKTPLCRTLAIVVVLFGVFVVALRSLTNGRTYPPHLLLSSTDFSPAKTQLKADLETIGTSWPGRHVLGITSSNYRNLTNMAYWIENQFTNPVFSVTQQRIGLSTILAPLPTNRYEPGTAFGDTWNIIAEIPAARTSKTGLPDIIILGAHYDTMAFNDKGWEGTEGRFSGRKAGTPGVNDNGSGVAALLALARFAVITHTNWTHTVRFVAFANEEPPFFQNTNWMGSWLYAKQCLSNGEEKRIKAVLSLENLANYSAELRNAKRPWYKDWLASLVGLSERPDYVAFMSGWSGGSSKLAKEWAQVFATNSAVSVRTVSLPFIARFGTEYFAWSDDWSFNQNELPSFAVCDTAFYRSARYHESWDTIDSFSDRDYEMFSKVVLALQQTLDAMASRPLGSRDENVRDRTSSHPAEP